MNATEFISVSLSYCYEEQNISQKDKFKSVFRKTVKFYYKQQSSEF